MIEWASQANGKVKGSKASLVSFILTNIGGLNVIKKLPWPSRKWALPAWREIQLIGILDRLELLPMQPQRPINEPAFPSRRIRQLCELLGLGYNKINGRIVITRTIYTPKSKEKCQADA